VSRLDGQPGRTLASHRVRPGPRVAGVPMLPRSRYRLPIRLLARKAHVDRVCRDVLSHVAVPERRMANAAIRDAPCYRPANRAAAAADAADNANAGLLGNRMPDAEVS
jgi:hypothetical protein